MTSLKLFACGQNKSVQLAYFLRDCAKKIVAAIRDASADLKTQLNHEFYAVCMMNALFGNPMLLLH
jgi:hypothetical protein